MSDDTVESIAARVRELTLDNERLFRELLSTERRFRSLSRSVWRVQEDERRRLARELHDGIGQTLTALKNELEKARRDRRVPEAAEGIGAALEMAAQALHDTRELSRILRPAVLDDLGLEPALRWLARSVAERFAVDVDLQLRGLDERVDREVETLAFRVVQEGLTNVAKHSGASRAGVEVEQSPGRLRIRISDGGRGFDPRQVLDAEHREVGVGLRGMRDRAELFGGNIRVDSEMGIGTRIEVLVPLDAKDGGNVPVIRVLVADDHNVVRTGIVKILAESGECDVVAEASDGPEAVDRAIETRPHVVVLDITMPRLNGIECVRRIREALPGTKVLALTVHDEEEYVLHMVKAGASGYLVKDSAAKDLIDAVRALHAGKGYFGPQASSVLAEQYQHPERDAADPYGALTPREREVFHLVTEGKTTKDVAGVLGISAKTAENHRTRVMEKLGVHNTAELVRYAARRGLLH